MPAASAAASPPASGSVARNGTSNIVVRAAVVYIPAPKNAPCPKLK
jgi:hypothetical protein